MATWPRDEMVTEKEGTRVSVVNLTLVARLRELKGDMVAPSVNPLVERMEWAQQMKRHPKARRA